MKPSRYGPRWNVHGHRAAVYLRAEHSGRRPAGRASIVASGIARAGSRFSRRGPRRRSRADP
jgi:hypothetical protein